MTKTSLKLFIILFAFGTMQVMAQKKAAHEFSVYANGGIATYLFYPMNSNFPSINYNSVYEARSKVNTSVGFSSDFGAGFTGFLSHQVGIHTSVGFGLLNVKSRANLYNLTTGLYDADNNEYFDLHTLVTDYTEIHKTMFVTIPLMIQFQQRQKQYWDWTRSQKAGFYAMGGVRVNFLFNNRYESGITTLDNAAYLLEYKNWAATQMFVGLGHFEGQNGAPLVSSSGKLDFGVMALISLEAGVKWRVDNNIFVYTGAFFDCGLNDPIRDKRQPYEYQDYTSTNRLDNFSMMSFSERVNLMVIGVKVRVAFSRRQRGY